MKNGGVWRRLAGSLLGTRQIYLCGAVRLNEKQETAIKIYENTKSENAKKYLKKYSKDIARRYLEEKRKEELIKFIGFGLLSKQGLQEILDTAKNEADVSAYALQMMQIKRTTADRFKL